MSGQTTEQQDDGPKYLPNIKWSRKVFTEILAKDPEDLTTDEFKLLFLHIGKASKQEKEKYGDMFLEENMYARLGDEYFEMLGELQELRERRARREPGRGWEHYLLTANELQAYIDLQEASLRSEHEALKMEFKAKKERWQVRQATRKRSRKAQRQARKRSRRN